MDINILTFKAVTNWIIDFIYRDFFSFIAVLCCVLACFWLVMAWALDLDNMVWEQLMKFLMVFLFFSLFVMLERGIIPFF